MSVKITECPRDAMQGLHDFIPTNTKISYLQSLLAVGFDVIDCGSFVSPKAIPQMADSGQVISALSKAGSLTKLSVVVANIRGAKAAADQNNIDIIGFPFSISETFQLKNTNSTISDSLIRVDGILEVCHATGKQPLIYISMAFGNPYGDEWSESVASNWIDVLSARGVTRFSLADTVGVAEPEAIQTLFSGLIDQYPNFEFSAHLHTHAGNWRQKVNAAYSAGCRHFESALLGFGGCPMAGNDLVGNLSTENLVEFLNEQKVSLKIDPERFSEVKAQAQSIFDN